MCRTSYDIGNIGDIKQPPCVSLGPRGGRAVRILVLLNNLIGSASLDVRGMRILVILNNRQRSCASLGVRGMTSEDIGARQTVSCLLTLSPTHTQT